jgi:hypothetical protein
VLHDGVATGSLPEPCGAELPSSLAAIRAGDWLVRLVVVTLIVALQP